MRVVVNSEEDTDILLMPDFVDLEETFVDGDFVARGQGFDIQFDVIFMIDTSRLFIFVTCHIEDSRIIPYVIPNINVGDFTWMRPFLTGIFTLDNDFLALTKFRSIQTSRISFQLRFLKRGHFELIDFIVVSLVLAIIANR